MSGLLSVLLSDSRPGTGFVEATAGFEPAHRGFADPSVTHLDRLSVPRQTTTDDSRRLLSADHSAVRRLAPIALAVIVLVGWLPRQPAYGWGCEPVRLYTGTVVRSCDVVFPPRRVR